MLTDSHAHLTSDPLFSQIDLVLQHAQEAKIGSILNINTNAQELERGLALAQSHPWVMQAAAVHPHDATPSTQLEAFYAKVMRAASERRLAAIGETGLDYHYLHASREDQQNSLKKHLELALSQHLPVVIHCREAFADLLQILDACYKGPGVLHCFTGTVQEAEQVLKRGLYISLSGIVTFKKSIELHQVAKEVPLERLLIETDAPFLAPQSRRGRQNEPAYVKETAEFIAHLRGISFEELADATTANAHRVLF